MPQDLTLKDLLNRGFAAQQAGDLNTAEGLYQKILKEAPQEALEYADACYMLGVVYSRQQKWFKAIEWMQKAIQCNPERAIYYFNLGQALSIQGRLTDARKAYTQALKLKPDLYSARFELGLTYVQEKKHTQAIPFFQDVLKKKPEHVQAAFQLGECLQILKHHPEAIKAYKMAIAANPQPGPSWRNLALSLQETGKLKAAVSAYQEALKSLPEDARIWHNLGNIHRRRGHMGKAIKAYQEALALNPELPELYYNLGAVLEHIGRLDDARIAFERYLKLAPKDAETPKVLCHLGRVLRLQEKRPGALKCYEMALKMNPRMPQAFNEVGLLFLELNQADKALMCFEQSLKLKPDLEDAALRRAYSAQVLGDLDAAEDYYKHAVEMNPNNLMAHLGVAGVDKERGDFEAAEDHFDKILQRSPEHLEALAGKAAVLEKQRRFDEAYALMQPIVEKGIKNASLANYYALVCQRLKKYDQAIDYLLLVLEDEAKIHFKLRCPLYFRLGEMYDKRKEADQAFAYFIKGNELKSHNFDMKIYQKETDLAIACFTPEFMATLPRADHGSRKPIFIFGMPRSGTTLTEQIVCSHPEVHGAGELRFMGKIKQDLRQQMGDTLESWQAYYRSLTVADLNLMARDYLEQIEALAPEGTLYITDKMPGNFQSLPLMTLLFPEATFIHCQRHLLDTCLSCFSKDFNHLEFTNDLESLGTYAQQYQRQMKHYLEAVSVPVLGVQYEATVADQEAASRRLIAHCGLDWDERCLDFYKTERHVKTASYDQVRNPIYTSSVARYKPYETYLQPIMDKIAL